MATLLYELDTCHLERQPRPASFRDRRPERASRVDRPVPISSGSFRPCWKGLSPIRSSLSLPLDSSNSFLHGLRASFASRSWRCENSFPQVENGPFSAQFWCNVSPFRINTSKSVSKQMTLTTFRMNTYEGNNILDSVYWSEYVCSLS